MVTRLIISWLLCTVAFYVCHAPADNPATMKVILAGVLVAIAICIVPLALQ